MKAPRKWMDALQSACIHLTMGWPAVCLILACGPESLSAATIVWENSATGFNAGANWVGGTAPGAADIGSFQAGTVSFNPQLTGSKAVGGLEFTSGTGAWTFSGNSGTRVLTIGSSGIVSNDDSTQTFNQANLRVRLGANTSFTSNSTGALMFGASLGGTIDGAFNLTLGGTSTNLGNSIAEIIAIAGAGGLTKAGGGTWTISGVNTYTGPTTVSAGTLRATTSASALGAGNLTLAGGALELANDTGLGFNRNTTVSSSSTLVSDRLTAGAGVTHTLGTLSIGAQNLTVTAGTNVTSGTAGLTFGATTLTGDSGFVPATGTLLTLGALADGSVARTLTFSGAGTTTLGSAATSLVNGTAVNVTAGTLNSNNATALGSLANVTVSSGATVALGASQTFGAINGTAGTINLGANTLTVGSTNNLNSTYSGLISGPSGNLIKTGTGTLTLAGSNSYAGATSVTAGAVKVTHNNGLSGTGVTVSNGAALQFAQDAGSNNINVAAVGAILNGTGLSSGGAIQNLNGSNTYQGAITLASASRINADTGSTLALTGGIASNSIALTVGGSGNTSLSGAINLDALSSGTRGALTKDGSGDFTFGAANTLTGTVGRVDMTAGSMTIGSGTHTNTLNATEFDSSAGTTLTIASGGMVSVAQAAGITSTFAGVMAGSGEFKFTGASSTSILALSSSFTASNLTLTLDGGTLSLLGGVNITVGTLHITGNTILDFGNSAGTFLTSSALIIDAGVTVTVNNWISVANNAAASTAWYATNTINAGTLGGTDQVGGTPLGQIAFTNYNGLTTTWVSGSHDGWFNHEIRPTPEPATYGAIFLSGCLGLLGWRRFRSRQKAAG